MMKNKNTRYDKNNYSIERKSIKDSICISSGTHLEKLVKQESRLDFKTQYLPDNRNEYDYLIRKVIWFLIMIGIKDIDKCPSQSSVIFVDEYLSNRNNPDQLQKPMLKIGIEASFTRVVTSSHIKLKQTLSYNIKPQAPQQLPMIQQIA